MTDISNPNDKFAKETLSRPKLATIFLANCLPPTLAESLDLEHLEITALRYYSQTAEGLTKKDFVVAVGEVLPRRKGKIMSTVFQEWKAETLAEGRKQGRQQGQQEGRQEGMVKLTLVQLQQRLGRISAAIRKKIVSLSSEKLEELGLALLEFHTQKDLSNWLARQDRLVSQPAPVRPIR